MKDFQRFLPGMVLSLALLVLAGCHPKNETALRISSWGDLQENRILGDLIRDYEKTHPGLKIELERASRNDYDSKLLTQIAGGDAPDVIFLETNNFVTFYKADCLEPLDAYAAADRVDLKAYYPQILNQFKMAGHTYVLPRDTAPFCVIYYNQDFFDQAGLPYPKDNWNWDEFVKTAQKLTRRDASGRTTRWGFVDDWPMIDDWVFDAGGSYVDDVKHPTRWTFATDPKTLRGIQFRADLMWKYKVMMPPSAMAAMGGLGTSDLFANRTAAMFLSGIWKTPQFRQVKNLRWDVVMLPRNPEGGRAVAAGGSGYGILKSSSHKKEAWDFVKYISGEEGARRLAAAGFAQPALMNIANSPVFLDGQPPLNKKMLLEAMKYVKYAPMCRNWQEVNSGILGAELDRVWAGTETAEEAMKKLKPLLEKNEPQTK